MLLNNQISKLPKVDQSLFLTQLINYTVRQINSGNQAFYKESLDLYKLGLEIGLVANNEKIDAAVFGNIVLLGCHAKDFEWVNQFMDTYQDYLKESIRNDAVTLNRGLWFFHQNDFENARDQFMNHSFSGEFQPQSRSNLIRTLYEQFLLDNDLYDLLIAQSNAFEKYLHRNKWIGVYKKEAHLNQLSILKKLATGIFQRKDRMKLKQSVENQIMNKGRIVGKSWLLSKAKELGK